MYKAVTKKPSNFHPSGSEEKWADHFLKTDEFFRFSYIRNEISKEKVFPLSGRPDTIKIANSLVLADEVGLHDLTSRPGN